jgi:hypothetical protein
MTGDTIPEKRRRSVEPLDDVLDHVRGPAAGRVILEYGDYECPFSRQAFRAIERVEQEMNGVVRFAFRHFPLVEIHPHAFASAAAAEAAAPQGRFWEMHELLFHRQEALRDDELQGMPHNSSWTSRASTRIDSALRSCGVSGGTSKRNRLG